MSMGRPALVREKRVLGRMAGSSATQQHPLGAFRLGKGSTHTPWAMEAVGETRDEGVLQVQVSESPARGPHRGQNEAQCS